MLIFLTVVSLKGVCHEIFDLHFFHDWNPSRPLIYRLKYSIFEFGFDFAEIFEFIKKLHGVHPSAKSSSAVCITPRCQASRCASYHGVKLRCVHHTAESNCTPHGVKIENFAGLWLLLRGQSGEILLGVNTSIMKEKILNIKNGKN